MTRYQKLTNCRSAHSEKREDFRSKIVTTLKYSMITKNWKKYKLYQQTQGSLTSVAKAQLQSYEPHHTIKLCLFEARAKRRRPLFNCCVGYGLSAVQVFSQKVVLFFA